MYRRIFFAFATLALLGVAQPLPRRIDANEQARLDLGSVRAIPQIYVPVHLFTSDQQLFVPYCGELDAENKLLCTAGAAHLEVYTGKGWQPAKLRTTYGVLGIPPMKQGTIIDRRSKATLLFEFSTVFFAVNRGQELRVVVDAWPDEQSMRAGAPSIRLTSPPFECPGLIR
jgi:hypothetical protein